MTSQINKISVSTLKTKLIISKLGLGTAPLSGLFSHLPTIDSFNIINYS